MQFNWWWKKIRTNFNLENGITNLTLSRLLGVMNSNSGGLGNEVVLLILANGLLLIFLTAAGLAQSVERLTAEREVVGSIPGAGPTLRVLK